MTRFKPPPTLLLWICVPLVLHLSRPVCELSNRSGSAPADFAELLPRECAAVTIVSGQSSCMLKLL
jgi:hypothetical protein